jgi:hypothetical protein
LVLDGSVPLDLNTGKDGSDAVLDLIVATAAGRVLIFGVRQALVFAAAVGRRALLHPVAGKRGSALFLDSGVIQLLDIGFGELHLDGRADRDGLASIRLAALGSLGGSGFVGAFVIRFGGIRRDSSSRRGLGLARLARLAGRLDDGRVGPRVETELLLDLIEAFLIVSAGEGVKERVERDTHLRHSRVLEARVSGHTLPVNVGLVVHVLDHIKEKECFLWVGVREARGIEAISGNILSSCVLHGG